MNKRRNVDWGLGIADLTKDATDTIKQLRKAMRLQKKLNNGRIKNENRYKKILQKAMKGTQ